jgi:hypothetical protein
MLHVIMCHNNVIVLHNKKLVWKESDKQFTQASKVQKYNTCADVQSVVSEKQNITVFDVITFHINGRMITEVYPCIVFLYDNMLSYICILPC